MRISATWRTECVVRMKKLDIERFSGAASGEQLKADEEDRCVETFHAFPEFYSSGASPLWSMECAKVRTQRGYTLV